MKSVFARAVRVWRGFRANGLRVTLRAVMRRCGVRVCHYYWMLERLPGEIPGNLTTLPDGLEFSTLGADEIAAIVAFGAPRDEVDAERLQQAFERGDLFVAVKRGDEILAFSGCSLDETHTVIHPAMMKPNEAYLSNMYVRPGNRGHNLAVILRYRCYAMLSALGRDTCYSITLASNHASARFKQKLGARKLYRALYLKVGSREWRWVVRRYPA